jgi:hypothetical protein
LLKKRRRLQDARLDVFPAGHLDLETLADETLRCRNELETWVSMLVPPPTESE